MPTLKQENTGQASTTSYATLLKVRNIGLTKSTVVITNSHAANGIKYRIMVSNDPQGSAASFGEEKSESTLAALASDRYVLSGSFAWFDCQIIDSSAGNHGVGNCWLMAVG